MSFSADFSKFPELWPRFSFDLRNDGPKYTRIYGLVDTKFSGKMARPRQMIG